MIIPSRSSAGAVALLSVALFLNGSAVNADTSEATSPPAKTTTVPVPVAVKEPHISLTGGIGGGSGKGGFEISIQFGNAGKESVTIVGIGRSGPGMQLLNPQRRGPYVILPGESIALQLKYRVTNCKIVPRGTWPIPLRVLRPKGEETIYPDPSIAGEEDQWYQEFVKSICGSR
ncbi:hypothetical protein [Nonomuraea sp. NPDC049158]|uniref:hypothetical protein n=1 Tax=Nonomuraea sp. NPDC049158 TaxID=3155649 RepID=UPI0033F0BFD4